MVAKSWRKIFRAIVLGVVLLVASCSATESVGNYHIHLNSSVQSYEAIRIKYFQGNVRVQLVDGTILTKSMADNVLVVENGVCPICKKKVGGVKDGQ